MARAIFNMSRCADAPSSGLLECHGQTGSDEMNPVADSRDMLIEKACLISEAASEGVFRNDRQPDFITHKHHGHGATTDSGDQILAPTVNIFTREQEVGQPESKAVDKDGTRLLRLHDGGGQVDRRLYRLPSRAPPGAMRGDSVAHLGIEGLRRGDIVDGAGQALALRFGMAALA